MSITRRKGHPKENGQAIVELALVLPILMLLVLGIIQFAIMFNNYLSLTDAVRVGARQAAVSRTLPDPTGAAIARVRTAARTSLRDVDLAVTVTPFDPGSGTASWVQGGDVTVRATYPYSISLLGQVVKSGFLTSETTERVE
jgi:Flp pilus assembly protein TadG